MGPFLVLSSAIILGVGVSAGVSPSFVLANRMTFWKVWSSFFQILSSVGVFSSSVGANLSLCWSSMVLAKRLIPSAMLSSVCVPGCCVVGMCILCASLLQSVLAWSVVADLAMWIISLVSVVLLVNDQSVSRRGK